MGRFEDASRGAASLVQFVADAPRRPIALAAKLDALGDEALDRRERRDTPPSGSIF